MDLLLCTDMDRTVIPNGIQKEDEGARQRFRDFCDRPNIGLAYVTGRRKSLVEEAISEFNLPIPDFSITDVGTNIYQINDKHWSSLSFWKDKIASDWHGRNHGDIQKLLSGFSELELQERENQTSFKLSYYVEISDTVENVLQGIDLRLKEHNIEAALVWSIDEQKNIGLLDVLPQNATKLHAILFLQKYLNLENEQIIFAGDSGNDLPVLTSHVNSVLVANASNAVREAALCHASRHGFSDALYLAKENPLAQDNGNYCSGVLQGIRFFRPDLILT